jgi:pimeloyl-ACP methyl ester carboxylesterase
VPERILEYTHDELRFDVSDWGPVGGRVVIALHGFPEDRLGWESLAGALADAGHRTLAPDQRGYSPGARPAGRRAYVLDRLMSDVLALADTAGAERFDVIGHDWGAIVAWCLAARHASRVRSLTALSVPHPGAFSAAALRSTQLLHSWYVAAFQVPMLPERALGMKGGKLLADGLVRDGLDRETATRYAARAAAGEMTGPLNWYRALPFEARNPIGPVPAEVPTLYVWGDRDSYVARGSAERCAAQVRGPYRFVPLRGVSHWLPTEAADQITPLVVDHLEGVPA